MSLGPIASHIASAVDFLGGATKYARTPEGLTYARAALVSAKKCIDRSIAAIDAERSKVGAACS